MTTRDILDVRQFSVALKWGGYDEESARKYLAIIAQHNGQVPDFEKAMVDMAAVYAAGKIRNLSAEISLWVQDYQGGWFTTQDLDRELNVGPNDKSNRRQALSRMVKQGVLEVQHGKAGVYRRLEVAVDPIYWKGAEFKEIDLKWPFGLEAQEITYERTLDVIAGASGAGKSAFIFNFIRMNMGNHMVRLMSSEMGEQQLKVRLSKFGLPDNQWTFDPVSRTSDFADAVLPDDINVIDYLETEGDAVFKVGDELRAIFNRLRKGMALVAIQKKMNTTREFKGKLYKQNYDLGRGAEFSMEKARLYLSIDYHKLKIVKASNWRQEEVNPKGMQWSFKLLRGCEFVEVQRFYPKDEEEA